MPSQECRGTTYWERVEHEKVIRLMTQRSSLEHDYACQVALTEQLEDERHKLATEAADLKTEVKRLQKIIAGCVREVAPVEDV